MTTVFKRKVNMFRDILRRICLLHDIIKEHSAWISRSLKKSAAAIQFERGERKIFGDGGGKGRVEKQIQGPDRGT